MTNNKGITLIALVITIIVLLILAGVSIAMLTGDNGILTQANKAKDDTAKAEIAEKVNMAIQSAYTDYVVNSSGVASTPMPVANVVTAYNTDNGASAAKVTSGNNIEVTLNSVTYTVALQTADKSYKVTKDNVTVKQ